MGPPLVLVDSMCYTFKIATELCSVCLLEISLNGLMLESSMQLTCLLFLNMLNVLVAVAWRDGLKRYLCIVWEVSFVNSCDVTELFAELPDNEMNRLTVSFLFWSGWVYLLYETCNIPSNLPVADFSFWWILLIDCFALMASCSWFFSR